jgi:N-acyl homoserine lactone hydrolase
MKIHALTTGTVRVKHSFLFPSAGRRRQLDLFTSGAFSDPLPIHCWAIEHEGVLRLVDTGETAVARDVPFARMQVTPEDELPAAMATVGLKLDDVSEVVLTHAHGDHIDGLVHLRARVLINETELRFAGSPMSRVMRRVLRQPLPPGFAPEPRVHVATLKTMLAHCAQHPTVYLPSHDPDSAGRLAAGATVRADGPSTTSVASIGL